MDVKTIFLNENLYKDNLNVSNSRKLPIKNASYKNTLIDLNKLQGVGIFIWMRQSDNLISFKIFMGFMFIK